MKLYLNVENLPQEAQLDELTQKSNAVSADTKAISVELSMTERRISRKMGDRRLAYVTAAEMYGKQYEAIMPRTFHSKELTERLAYYHKLAQLQATINEISELLGDTMMACGIDLMTLTRIVHDGLRSANAVNPSYDAPLSRLDEFNKRATSEEKEEETQNMNTDTERLNDIDG